MAGKKHTDIFADAELQKDLVKHLMPLQNSKLASIWHEDGKTRVVPVIARTCLWQEESFAKLQALLKGKAISTYTDKDEALTEVAKNIKQFVSDVQ